MRGRIGRLILEKWQFSDALIQMAEQAEDWQYDHEGAPDYVDIIVLAQLYSFRYTQKPDDVPVAETVPSFFKLNMDDGEEDSGLVVLIEADAEIDETENLLGA